MRQRQELTMELLLSLLEKGTDVLLTMEPKQPKDGGAYVQVETVRLEGDAHYRRFNGWHRFHSMWKFEPSTAEAA